MLQGGGGATIDRINVVKKKKGKRKNHKEKEAGQIDVKVA